jgi:hypothetical protein
MYDLCWGAGSAQRQRLASPDRYTCGVAKKDALERTVALTSSRHSCFRGLTEPRVTDPAASPS